MKLTNGRPLPLAPPAMPLSLAYAAELSMPEDDHAAGIEDLGDEESALSAFATGKLYESETTLLEACARFAGEDSSYKWLSEATGANPKVRISCRTKCRGVYARAAMLEDGFMCGELS